MTLYELTGSYKDFERNLDYFAEAIESGEMDEQVFDDTLAGLQASIEDKADNIACMIKNIMAEAKAIKEEEQRLKERREAKERMAERLKEYLSEQLIFAGIPKIDTARNKLTFRKSEQVIVEDEAKFIDYALQNDLDMLLTVKAPTVNKTEIKKAIKAGEKLPMVTIAQKTNLQIK